jgi:alginate O-acetyltransferase complex protein AlgI
MVFSDLFFLFVFLPSVALCYLLAAWLDKHLFSTSLHKSFTARNAVLVLFSLIFYAWGEPVYVLLMLACVFLTYLSGRIIGIGGKYKKSGLVFGLICNIGILSVFKYTSMLVQTLNQLGLDVPDPKISLPIGISFYIFQSISYLVDIYRGDSPVQKNFLRLLLYISMFPQLIAGPIVRYDVVAMEIGSRRVTQYDFVCGSYRFLIGLGKKVILANQLSEISTQFLGGNLANTSTAGAWVGILAFTLQIFFDFSGYSDMAIGLGRCLGFHFAENFNHPYISKTITEFWRRWHMSLGSFFRDYVYIPMGGNRRHQAWNIMVVWFLTGMWHGASWNFILWGVYFGIIVMLEKYTILKVIRYIPAPLLHLYTIFLFVLGWGIFYFDDFTKMQRFFSISFGNTATLYDFTAESAVMNNFWLWIVALIFCLPVYDIVTNAFDRAMPKETTLKHTISLITRISVSVALLLTSVALLVGATNNAFIYTRF